MAWNGSNSKAEQVRQMPPPSRREHRHIPLIKGTIAGLIVCIGAALGYLFLCRDTRTKADVPKIKIDEAILVAALGHKEKPNVEEPASEPAINPDKRYEDGVEVVSSVVTTNTSGAIIEKLVLANGKRKSKIQPPKPVFENAAEQVIAMAISVKPGQSMPPLPRLDASLEKDFLDSLTNPVRIKDDDSDEVKEMKARVLETKAYIADEIKNGSSLLEVLREHQEMMERNADAHLMAIEEMQKIRAEYGEAEAEAFRDRINESFRARGIAELEKKQSDESRRNAE